jgi:hypothetical protein
MLGSRGAYRHTPLIVAHRTAYRLTPHRISIPSLCLSLFLSSSTASLSIFLHPVPSSFSFPRYLSRSLMWYVSNSLRMVTRPVTKADSSLPYLLESRQNRPHRSAHKIRSRRQFRIWATADRKKKVTEEQRVSDILSHYELILVDSSTDEVAKVRFNPIRY